jgi:Holliday junction resolvase RusA-like endonuclease
LNRRPAQFVRLEFETRPISVNAIWRPIIRNGRPAIIKSKEYRDWIIAAGQEIEAQSPGCVYGAYAIKIEVFFRSRKDPGNVEKAISDLLQLHGVIENDSKCQQIFTKRSVHPTTVVTVTATREVGHE